MGALDIVTQMKSQGKSDSEIIQNLRNQGISPQEIQNTLSQANIKNAVIKDSNEQDMQQSIMDNPPEPMQEQYEEYSPQFQQPQNFQQENYPAYPEQNFAPQENYPNQNFSSQENYPSQYPQEAYSADYPEYSQSATDTNTLIEISEQVFTDKVKKIQNMLEKLNEFKTLTDAKVKTMETRLKRIESTMDQLQSQILEKVGSYGSNLSSIKKEMSMMQDSFGKVINPLLDKKRKRL